MQDALEKNKTTAQFMLTVPTTTDKFKVMIGVSGTPNQFLLNVFPTIHTCKQLGLVANFTKGSQLNKYRPRYHVDSSTHAPKNFGIKEKVYCEVSK